VSSWIRRRRRDEFYRKAKDEGYRSRASYKLIQLNRRYRLFRRGDRVLDLGCAPGGWCQVARQLVGSTGFVLGIDLSRTPSLEYDNVVCIVGDIMDSSTTEDIVSYGLPFDIVISDAAPSISGVWSRDHLVSVDLANRALDICEAVLRPGGNYVAKVFQGDELDALHRRAKGVFESVKRGKPKASRGESSEIYIIGKGFRGPGSDPDAGQ
jgi:23S rRNA (uridine2552-2'-O)-methyltransferase